MQHLRSHVLGTQVSKHWHLSVRATYPQEGLQTRQRTQDSSKTTETRTVSEYSRNADTRKAVLKNALKLDSRARALLWDIMLSKVKLFPKEKKKLSTLSAFREYSLTASR